MTVAATPSGSLTLADVRVGDTLPEQTVATSRTTIVAAAIASRDYQDVHHDPGLARQGGSEDIFLNILSTNGYVLRLITDWAGPEAIVERCAIRLGVPNYAGDTLTLTGEVTAVEAGDDDGTVTVEVTGANARGDHVTGTVQVNLPAGDTA